MNNYTDIEQQITIERAIEILDLEIYHLFEGTSEEKEVALVLGIEALTRLNEVRQHGLPIARSLSHEGL